MHPAQQHVALSGESLSPRRPPNKPDYAAARSPAPTAAAEVLGVQTAGRGALEPVCRQHTSRLCSACAGAGQQQVVTVTVMVTVTMTMTVTGAARVAGLGLARRSAM